MSAKDAARGKALELTVGRIFGGRRRRNGEGVGFDDCVDEDGFELPISIECKAHSVLQIRQSWIAQAIRNAKGRPWLLLQRPFGSSEIYVTVYLKTLIDPEFHALIQELTNRTKEETSGEEEQSS